MKKGLVFGVFDGLHEGHRHFLNDAKARCDELVVVLARDEIVRLLKNRSPENGLDARTEALSSFDPELHVIPGDTVLGSWGVLERERPDIIFLGYDQSAIAAELKRLDIAIQSLSPFQPEIFKSGLLRNRHPKGIDESA